MHTPNRDKLAAAMSDGNAPERYRVLIVEDDHDLASALSGALEKYGYAVSRANNYDEITKDLCDAAAHLVLLDVNLPRFDGFALCRHIREVSSVPILFISARDSSMDQIMGLSAGGDDYLTKPFSPDVLIAKIRALLRRSYEFAGGQRDLIGHAGMTLDLQNATVRCNGRSVELSRNEFRVLRCLMRRAGEIVTRNELIEALWQREAYVDENTLSVNVNRLRKRLSEAGQYDVIVTRRGQGYTLR